MLIMVVDHIVLTMSVAYARSVLIRCVTKISLLFHMCQPKEHYFVTGVTKSQFSVICVTQPHYFVTQVNPLTLMRMIWGFPALWNAWQPGIPPVCYWCLWLWWNEDRSPWRGCCSASWTDAECSGQLHPRHCQDLAIRTQT